MAEIIHCKKDIAVIGAGHWGKNHIRILNDLRRLHTICEKRPPHEWNFKAPDAVGWVDELEYIQENPQIKGVIIATPPESHYEIAMKMLKSKKHVLVEKPMCMSSRNGNILKIEASAQERILMVGHLLQYHNGFRTMRRLIDEGRIGELRYIYSNRLNLGRIRENENVWWSFAPHDISMILALTGEAPEKVWAKGWHGLKQKQCDSTITYLTFKKGINAHIYVSWLHPFKRHELVGIGSEGMIVFDNCRPWDEKVCLYKPDKDLKGSEQKYVRLAAIEPLEVEIKHFLECCDKTGDELQRKPVTDSNEGIKVLKALENAQRSMEANSD